jgi:hypothetical protein
MRKKIAERDRVDFSEHARWNQPIAGAAISSCEIVTYDSRNGREWASVAVRRVHTPDAAKKLPGRMLAPAPRQHIRFETIEVSVTVKAGSGFRHM